MRPLPEPNPAFREEFLVLWGASEHAETLQRFGNLLSSAGRETSFLDADGTSYSQELRALTVDIEAVARRLDRDATEDWEDKPLRRSAAAWARQLRKVGAAMEIRATAEKEDAP